MTSSWMISNTKKSIWVQARCWGTKTFQGVLRIGMFHSLNTRSLKRIIPCTSCAHGFPFLLNRMPALLDDVVQSDRADDKLTEEKALKQITFPEMDSDGLPSTYIPKVLGCLGKWEMKMHDLASELTSCGKASVKPSLGLNHYVIQW